MLIPRFSTVTFTEDTEDNIYTIRWIKPKKTPVFLQQLPTHKSNMYLPIVLLQEIGNWLVR